MVPFDRTRRARIDRSVGFGDVATPRTGRPVLPAKARLVRGSPVERDPSFRCAVMDRNRRGSSVGMGIGCAWWTWSRSHPLAIEDTSFRAWIHRFLLIDDPSSPERVPTHPLGSWCPVSPGSIHRMLPSTTFVSTCIEHGGSCGLGATMMSIGLPTQGDGGCPIQVGMEGGVRGSIASFPSEGPPG